MFYAGDTYNFILNIPNALVGVMTVTTAPTISVLDITDPGSPIVSGASMTLIAGTSFVYYYTLTIPNATPKDYIAIYSYALRNDQDLSTATAVTWSTNIASYTFPLPLPVNTVPGNLLTTVGFTSSGPGDANVVDAPILTVDSTTGIVTIAMPAGDPNVTVLGTGTASTVATISNQIISETDKLHVGDSNITGQVALNSTVAQNATVAKDATVMKSAQYVAPQNDPLVQTIGTTVASIESDTSSTTTLLGTLGAGSISGLLQDVYDNVFGSWSIDQTLNPPVLSMKRINGTLIATFQLVNNPSVTQRNVLTSPPESSI